MTETMFEHWDNTNWRLRQYKCQVYADSICVNVFESPNGWFLCDNEQQAKDLARQELVLKEENLWYGRWFIAMLHNLFREIH